MMENDKRIVNISKIDLRFIYLRLKKKVNISDTFSQREFIAALEHLKPGKALGPDYVCP